MEGEQLEQASIELQRKEVIQPRPEETINSRRSRQRMRKPRTSNPSMLYRGEFRASKSARNTKLSHERSFSGDTPSHDIFMRDGMLNQLVGLNEEDFAYGYGKPRKTK